MSVLAVRSLSKAFGGVRAVNEVSFAVGAGEFLAMIGPNGAGKSTCFNMINGQLAPDSGEILFEGKNIAGLTPREIWRLGVGRTFQVAATFGSMTVVENVQMALISHAGEIYRLWRPAAALHRERALDLLAQVGMREAADRPSRELAYGDVKRVELAIALANEPRLLLMDEPTAGMGARERHELIALVKRLVVERGISVLFTEHSMDVVFAFADRIIVLARGRLIADGDAAAIRDNAQVREVYFGTGKTFARSRVMRRCHARGRGLKRLVRRGAHSLRSELRGRPRRGGGADGPQRRRQVHHHEGDHGSHRRAAGHACASTASDISRLKPFEIARRGLGFTPEDRRIFADLTVMENLDIGRQPPRRFADGAPAPAWTPEKLFALFPNLAEMPNRLGDRMSGGEQQMLTVARTLMGNPLLVLLDEPSEGVAPLIVEQMANTIVELKKEGLSILLSEQNIHFARLVSDRVYVLEKGQIRWQGSMAQLDSNLDVQRAYLTV